MTVRIESRLIHEVDAGDGVVGRLVSSRKGTLGRWHIKNGQADTTLGKLEVKQGDTVDFIVDFAANLNSDMFKWSPVILAIDAPAGTNLPVKWNAYQEFTGPPPAREPMDPWAMYAQVLLLSNEFVFVD